MPNDNVLILSSMYDFPYSLVVSKLLSWFHVLIAELQGAKPASEAPLVRKIGNPSSRENLVLTSPCERPSSVQTLREGEGRLSVTCDSGCSQLTRHKHVNHVPLEVTHTSKLA